KIGRRNILALSILLMAGSTLVIGLLPTYGTLGIAATVLLVLARLLQGFSCGGEYTGAGLYAVEHAPPGRRGFYGSMMQAGIGLGLFLGSMSATVLTYLLTQEQLAAFGWRIPFIIGGLLGGVGLFLRSRAME